MTCYIVPMKSGGRMFLCGDLGPQCGCGDLADVLCDYPVGNDKTCDANLCSRCAPEIAPNINYCDGHLQMWKAYRETKGDERVLENVLPFRAAASIGKTGEPT
jgi:hypothetical protein